MSDKKVTLEPEEAALTGSGEIRKGINVLPAVSVTPEEAPPQAFPPAASSQAGPQASETSSAEE